MHALYRFCSSIDCPKWIDLSLLCRSHLLILINCLLPESPPLIACRYHYHPSLSHRSQEKVRPTTRFGPGEEEQEGVGKDERRDEGWCHVFWSPVFRIEDFTALSYLILHRVFLEMRESEIDLVFGSLNWFLTIWVQDRLFFRHLDNCLAQKSEKNPALWLYILIPNSRRLFFSLIAICGIKNVQYSF